MSPRPLLPLAAALVLVLVVTVIVIDRGTRSSSVEPAKDEAATPDLSRAMTFTPPAEPKR